MQGVAHFQRGEFERALQLIERALAQRPGDASARFNRALVVNALARRPAEAELEREAAVFATAMRGDAHTRDDHAVRVIAFYLPQFHRDPGERRLVGRGLHRVDERAQGAAELRRPRAAAPAGRARLLRPADPAVREAQARLARAHGVDAFCYYHYWFGGRRLLERPLDAVLASGKPDFPFCVCWANENWTRRWDGLDHEILMAAALFGRRCARLHRRACSRCFAIAATSASTGGRCCSSTSSPICPTSPAPSSCGARSASTPVSAIRISQRFSATRRTIPTPVRVRCRGRVPADRARGREHRVAAAGSGSGVSRKRVRLCESRRRLPAAARARHSARFAA